MTTVPFPYKRRSWPEPEGESYTFECIQCSAPMHVPHQEDCLFAVPNIIWKDMEVSDERI